MAGITFGIRLLRQHSRRQIHAERRKRLRRERRRSQAVFSEVDMKDVYIPPLYLPRKPHTYGTQKQVTVIKTGTTIGMEAAF